MDDRAASPQRISPVNGQAPADPRKGRRVVLSRRNLLGGTAAAAAVTAVGRPAAAAASQAAAQAPAGNALGQPGPGGGPSQVVSPDGRLVVSVAQAGGQVVWSVNYDGAPVILPSSLGLSLASGGTLGPGARPVRGGGLSRRRLSGSWQPQYGRQQTLTEHCEEGTLTLADPATGTVFAVIVRAYDAGAAIRYQLVSSPGARSLTLSGEQTMFGFPASASVYTARDEDPFLLVPPGQIPVSGGGTLDTGPLTDQPLGVALPGTLRACICESARQNYPRLMLSSVSGQENSLVSHLMAYPGRGSDTPEPTFSLPVPFSTPWRVIVVGATAADVVNHADLVVTLANPGVVADSSWVRPGKVMRINSLTTADALATIDFAAENGLQYVEFDSGWYGSEFSASSNPLVPIAAIDMPQVISYGAAKGIGVLVYVNRLALSATSQAQQIMSAYQQWGIAGMKLGFILDGNQAETSFNFDLASLAAEHKLIVNMHDDLRPWGQERTLPNWINMEGVRGNEHFPTATHNVTLPFTRNIGGPLDYTICLGQARDQTTNAHQLALAAVLYQPLEWLYWYSDPSNFSVGQPELAFWDTIPTVWDESRCLAGEIGQYIVMARRSGTTWYVGTATNEQGRTVDVPLNFLGDGQWQATIYADSPPGTAITNPTGGLSA
jgi:alpha-glucosidase